MEIGKLDIDPIHLFINIKNRSLISRNVPKSNSPPSAPLRTSTPTAMATIGGAHTNGFTPQHPITPGGLDGDQSIVAGSRVVKSARHEALFTYFARIVKDVWRRNLCTTRQNNVHILAFKTFYSVIFCILILQVFSLLSRQEVEQVAHFLNALRRSIDANQLITAPTSHHHHYHQQQQFSMQQQQQQQRMGSGESNCECRGRSLDKIV